MWQPRVRRPGGGAVLNLVLDIIAALLIVYAGLIVMRAVLSWFDLAPGGRAFRIRQVLTTATEPYLGPFRRLIPVSRLGMSAPHDFSVLVALLLLYVVSYVLIAI